MTDTLTKSILLGLLVGLLSGCATKTKTVVVPKPHYVHSHAKHHVVYHVKPARRHCWRHRGHWDCR